jgi:hypothetical protein
MSNFNEVIARWRRHSLIVLNNPNLFTPSQRMLAIRFLKQHGAKGPIIQSKGE